MAHSMITLSLPGSKSITNRALLLAALSNKTTTLYNVLLSDDTKYMMAALKKCGVKIKRTGSTVKVSGTISVTGKKLNFFCGNSGTTLRFILATLATYEGDFTLTGDTRMQERPIKDLVESLRQLGAKVEYTNREGYPPVRITKALIGGHCKVSGEVSSQYLSGIMMAAAFAKNKVAIEITGELVSKPYVDMTAQMIKEFDKHTAPSRYQIEADASSASYFWGLGVLTQTHIEIENIPQKSLQGDVFFKELCGKFKQNQLPKKIDCSDFPDTAMTLAMLCAVTPGTYTLTGLQSLRVKECNRLAALEKELNKIGVTAESTKSSLTIIGRSPSVLIEQNKKKIILIETYNDHRVAMCFGMLGAILPYIKVKNPECVKKTFPAFWKVLNRVTKKIAARNVVLVGMRGSGKTEVGKSLATILKRPFIDIDQEITKFIKKPISEFVNQNGWSAFRAIEKKITANVAKKRNAVISCGGGTIIDSDNALHLKVNGLVAYLSCSLQELTRRLSRASNLHRPKLTQHSKSITDELSELVATREPIYRAAANLIFDSSENSGSMARDIITKAKRLATLVRTCGIK